MICESHRSIAHKLNILDVDFIDLIFDLLNLASYARLLGLRKINLCVTFTNRIRNSLLNLLVDLSLLRIKLGLLLTFSIDLSVDLFLLLLLSSGNNGVRFLLSLE